MCVGSLDAHKEWAKPLSGHSKSSGCPGQPSACGGLTLFYLLLLSSLEFMWHLEKLERWKRSFGEFWEEQKEL